MVEEAPVVTTGAKMIVAGISDVMNAEAPTMTGAAVEVAAAEEETMAVLLPKSTRVGLMSTLTPLVMSAVARTMIVEAEAVAAADVVATPEPMNGVFMET